jgi:hypothetical protein
MALLFAGRPTTRPRGPTGRLLLPLATLLAATATPAQETAGTASAASADVSLGRVEVIGHYDNAIGTSSAASEGAVTAKLIANRPALRVGEVLEFVPGMIVTQHSGGGKANQYFLRGFNLDHGTDFATFVDGMPVNMVSHAHGQGYSDLNFLIPELVKRIDYRKGPYFAREGDFASAGSARFALADQLPGTLAQLTLGEGRFRRALLADSTGWADGQLLGALELQGNDGPWQVGEGLHKANGWLRWSRKAEGSERSATAMVYDSRWTSTDQVPLRAVNDGSLDRFGSLDPSDGGRTRRISLSAQQRTATDTGSWQAGAYAISSRLNLWSNFTFFLDHPITGDQFEQAEERRVLGGELSRRWNLDLGGHEHQLTLGLQVRQDRIAPLGLFHTVQRQRLSATQESRVRETLWGGYGELASTWTPWLRSVAGLRADEARFDVASSAAGSSGRASDRAASPKLSLVFGPWARSEFFANWGRGFHSNDARGTTVPEDRVPGLAASRGSEVGARTEAVAGLQSSLALWRLDLDSELVFVGDAGTTEAARPSRRQGAEWNNHWQLGRVAPGAEGWLLDADLAASRARFRDTAPEGNRVPGAVNRAASLGLAYEGAGPWFGALQLRHFGPRDLVEDGSVRSDATTLAYLRAGRRLAPGTSLSLDVFNLFDRAASDIDYFYESRLGGETAPVADRHFHPVEPRSLRVTLAMNFR